MLGLITGPLGKVAGITMLLMSLSGAALGWLHVHDNAVRAVMQASADKVIATAQAADAAHEVAALSAQAIDNAASISRLQSIREKTHAAPVTTGCASSPAVSALLDGLRDSHSNHPGTTATGSR